MIAGYRVALLSLLGFASCAEPNEVLPIRDQSGGTGAFGGGGMAGDGAGGAGASGKGGSGGSSGVAGSMAGTSSGGSGGNAAGAGGSAGTQTSGGTGGSAGTSGTSGGKGGTSGSAGTSSGGKGGMAGTAGTAGTSGSGGTDACPADPMKTEPGECGCGVPDTDSDDDDTPDCDDDCPMDPLRTAPTDCACGGNAACLLHRYSFAGTGTTVEDSIGSADGTAEGATLSGGSITLAGGTSDEYVDLPDSALAGLTSATFEAWVTWTSGTATWERIFDFGDSDGGDGAQGAAGITYLFLTPRAGTGNRLRAAFTLSGPDGEVTVDAAAALATNTMTQVAVVFDGDAQELSLYLDGDLEGSAAVMDSLSDLNAVNNWLGRSQFQSDPEFTGSIHEFRIYGSARTASQLSESANAGPDDVPDN